MKIDAFLTLDAALRGGSLAAAAAEMNLTPSAVSMQMKQLEGYLGQPLFDRSGLQVRPMPLAEEVAALMRAPLHTLDALRHRAGTAVEGVIRLGVIESMQPMLLPGTLKRLRERHPRLELRPVRGKSVTLTAAVKAGELDAAVVGQPESGGSARLRWTALMKRELVLIVPPDGPLQSVAAYFRQYEWIRYDRETVTGSLAARYVHAHVGARRGQLEFDSAPAIAAMVSAGLGISVLQVADPGMLRAHPVRIVRLGRDAPVVRFALVSRKEADARVLAALEEALAGAVVDTR